MSEQVRPGRPFGLTLAIFATALMYSIVPLMQLGFNLLIMSHFNTLDLNMPWSGGDEVIFSGADANIVSARDILLVGGVGIGFLVIAIFAYRGRPAWSRYVLFYSVVALNVINLVSILSKLLRPSDVSQGFTSADDFFRSAELGYVVAMSLVTLYLIWYMNRAPARAFYRGYYLPAEALSIAGQMSGQNADTLHPKISQ